MKLPNGTLISFDPGLREAGLAVFTNGLLTSAFLVRNPNTKDRGGRAWRAMGQTVFRTLNSSAPNALISGVFVSEIPQVYREGKSANVSPDDLTNLTGVVGCVIGFLDPSEVKTYVPAEWKGQVPKKIHNDRIEAALNMDEVKVLDAVKCPASLLHNVVDAIGVGLFELGRMGGTNARVRD